MGVASSSMHLNYRYGYGDKPDYELAKRRALEEAKESKERIAREKAPYPGEAFRKPSRRDRLYGTTSTDVEGEVDVGSEGGVDDSAFKNVELDANLVVVNEDQPEALQEEFRAPGDDIGQVDMNFKERFLSMEPEFQEYDFPYHVYEIRIFKSPQELVDGLDVFKKNFGRVFLRPAYTDYVLDHPDVSEPLLNLKKGAQDILENFEKNANTKYKFQASRLLEAANDILVKRKKEFGFENAFTFKDIFAIMCDSFTMYPEKFEKGWVESWYSGTGFLGAPEYEVFSLDRCVHVIKSIEEQDLKSSFMQMIFDMDYAIPVKDVRRPMYFSLSMNDSFLSVSRMDKFVIPSSIRVRITRKKSPESQPEPLEYVGATSDIWTLEPVAFLWQNSDSNSRKFHCTTTDPKNIIPPDARKCYLVSILYKLSRSPYKRLRALDKSELPQSEKELQNQINITQLALGGTKAVVKTTLNVGTYAAGKAMSTVINTAEAMVLGSVGFIASFFVTPLVTSAAIAGYYGFKNMVLSPSISITKSVVMGSMRLVYLGGKGALRTAVRYVNVHPLYRFDQTHARREMTKLPSFHFISCVVAILLQDSRITDINTSLSKSARSLLTEETDSWRTIGAGRGDEKRTNERVFCSEKVIDFAYKVCAILGEIYFERHRNNPSNKKDWFTNSHKCLEFLLSLESEWSAQNRGHEIHEMIMSLHEFIHNSLAFRGRKPSKKDWNPKPLALIKSYSSALGQNILKSTISTAIASGSREEFEGNHIYSLDSGDHGCLVVSNAEDMQIVYGDIGSHKPYDEQVKLTFKPPVYDQPLDDVHVPAYAISRRKTKQGIMNSSTSYVCTRMYKSKTSGEIIMERCNVNFGVEIKGGFNIDRTVTTHPNYNDCISKLDSNVEAERTILVVYKLENLRK